MALAAEQAKKRGVGHLVEFLHGDFMGPPFAQATFDAVLNHETFCYAPDKLAYLRRVLAGRTLAVPGGFSEWRSHVAGPGGSTCRGAARLAHASARVPARRGCGAREGHEDIGVEDLSSEAAVSTRNFRKRLIVLTMLAGPTGGQSRASQEFTEATVNYDLGPRQGAFAYRFISGARPT